MLRCRLVVALLLVATPALAQRLPSTVVPSHYDITVAPDLAAARFAGTERISVTLAKPSTAIVLNAAEIAFDTVSVTAGGRTQTARVSLDAAKEQVTFTVPVLIPAGPAEIAIKYRGMLNDQLRGLYLSKANNRRYAVTQLEATDARRMFPSFDEPAFKATFTLTATIDQGDHAISNGAVASDTPGPGAGKHTVTFDRTPKMSTYLVALAVGDFECLGGNTDGIPIRVCSTPDKKGQTGFALEAAQEILRYYDRYYAVKYPFKKLDVVAVPDFAAGAMENTAAIFYRETLLLADPKGASVAVRKNVAVVLAHEMAHQWFGDLVTMQWWDDIWLNEGFANWMETKPIKAWKPEWHVELDEVQSNQRAMSLDSLQATRPIRFKASTPAQISELFDAIAYEKGAAVLRMIEAWVGEDAFRTGVNAYIDRFKYANARAEDFWGTLTSSTHKPVDRVMAGFVDRPGVPLVDTAIRCDAGRGAAVLTQERPQRGAVARSGRGAAAAQSGVSSAGSRTASPESRAPNPGSQAWTIPVCVKTPAGKTACEVLAAPVADVPLDTCPAWVMANAGARGYYRVVNPPEMVRSIGRDVESLAPAERIALLSDEWALVRAKRHDVGTFLDLASGFKAERTAAVIEALTGPLATIGEYLTSDASRAAYRTWVSSLLRPALQEVGWTPSPGEADEKRELRALLVAALGNTARDPDVIAKAKSVVLEELAKPGTSEPTLLNDALTVAARTGDAALYEKYLARSKAASSPEERYRYIYALTSFSDPALVRRTLDYILGPDVRNQDATPLIASLLANRDAQALAWKLLQARWNEVQKKTGGFAGNIVIVGALSAFCDAGTLADLRQFFVVHKVPEAERTLKQATERISTCSDLAAAQSGKLTAWLEAQGLIKS
jgi:aminopeptidase N